MAALEELRLFSCVRHDAQPPFSLILCGNGELLPKLDLNVNRALVSRLSVCLHLHRWTLEALRGYLDHRLREAGIHTSPMEPSAETLLAQAAQGLPRHLNALLLFAMQKAADANRRTVNSGDVQSALDALPWFARASVPRSP